MYISYRTAPIENLGKNVEIKGPISSIDGCKVQFKDGTHIYADSIIYCTGKIDNGTRTTPWDIIYQISNSIFSKKKTKKGENDEKSPKLIFLFP